MKSEGSNIQSQLHKTESLVTLTATQNLLGAEIWNNVSRPPLVILGSRIGLLVGEFAAVDSGVGVVI